jgi:hypothetical protein
MAIHDANGHNQFTTGSPLSARSPELQSAPYRQGTVKLPQTLPMTEEIAREEPAQLQMIVVV